MKKLCLIPVLLLAACGLLKDDPSAISLTSTLTNTNYGAGTTDPTSGGLAVVVTIGSTASNFSIASVTGGTAPYTFTLDNGAPMPVTIGATIDAEAGTHTLVVFDSAGLSSGPISVELKS